LSKKTIESKVSELENRCGKKKLVTVLHDCSIPGHLYEIPGQDSKMNEAEFQKWKSKLPANSELFIIGIYLNRPGMSDAET
jgi:hypothetical protein